MSGLDSALTDYLAVRRALGYKLDNDERALRDFVAVLDTRGAEVVTIGASLEWAAGSQRGANAARRLSMVRGFARYLQALDPAHQVPPVRLLPSRVSRRVPYLYTDVEIGALMAAARRLIPRLRAATTETVIGLLAATGMRPGEVLALNVADVDWDTATVTVWLSKFGRSRHVPLTATTLAALARYRQRRRQALTTRREPAALFVTCDGQRLKRAAFAYTFGVLLDRTGIGAGPQRPRVYDLRHSFAVATVLDWYRHGADVHALLPRLSTYLGHVAPASTYWYLSAAPELMATAAQRLEHHHTQEVGR